VKQQGYGRGSIAPRCHGRAAITYVARLGYPTPIPSPHRVEDTPSA
jgi:hypothetical protein